MQGDAVPYLTPEQYLEIERAAEFRSEYLAGAMYAMAGASVDHGRIVGNTFVVLHPQLQGRDCEPAILDTRLAVLRHDLITYPDIFVRCGPDQYLDNRRDTLSDATLIIEALSVSTKNYDRREKFFFYRSLPSFREYLLIAQERVLVEHHIRQPDDAWLMREYASLADSRRNRADLHRLPSAPGCRLRSRRIQRLNSPSKTKRDYYCRFRGVMQPKLCRNIAQTRHECGIPVYLSKLTKITVMCV
jgi:Uma2 family endonuclease